MHVYPIQQFVGGWFVGNFQPAILQSSACEVAVKYYKAGDRERSHHHKVATELTAIISGRVAMSGRTVSAGELVQIDPGESTDFVALEDAATVVVKLPSVIGDKYFDSHEN